jgi:hypothetical protein
MYCRVIACDFDGTGATRSGRAVPLLADAELGVAASVPAVTGPKSWPMSLIII